MLSFYCIFIELVKYILGLEECFKLQLFINVVLQMRGVDFYHNLNTLSISA